MPEICSFKEQRSSKRWHVQICVFFMGNAKPQRNKQTPMFSHPISTERSELLLRHKIPNSNNPSPQQPPPETCFKSHRIHVCYIYLHLGDFYRVHVGTYTVRHMDPLRTLPSNPLPPTRSVSSAAIRLLKVAIVQPWKAENHHHPVWKRKIIWKTSIFWVHGLLKWLFFLGEIIKMIIKIPILTDNDGS